jgi:hypothetical protein
MATGRLCHAFADGMNSYAGNPSGSIPFLSDERRQCIFAVFREALTDATTWRRRAIVVYKKGPVVQRGQVVIS